MTSFDSSSADSSHGRVLTHDTALQWNNSKGLGDQECFDFLDADPWLPSMWRSGC